MYDSDMMIHAVLTGQILWTTTTPQSGGNPTSSSSSSSSGGGGGSGGGGSATGSGITTNIGTRPTAELLVMIKRWIQTPAVQSQ